MLYLAAGYVAFHLGVLLYLRYGISKMTVLPATRREPAAWPSLTVVFAARNEADNFRQRGVQVLGLDYPGLQFVFVNDRSTDATGSLLDAAGRTDGRVRVVHVEDLPPGWLGKNHALHQAAAACSSELILFTDADVQIETDFLKRAVLLLERQNLDYLTAMARLWSRSPWASPVLGSFILGFLVGMRPWLGKNPASRQAIGIGAFGLVRRQAYLAAGGHEPIRLRPDDDIRLARWLKQKGLRVDCVFGSPGVEVEWYETLGSMARGLEKNTLAAGFDYSLVHAAAGLGTQFVTLLLPYALLLVSSGPAQGLFALSIGFLSLSYATAARKGGVPLWTAGLLPLGVLVIFAIFLRGIVLTLWRGGICWRDTFYSLEELKKNRL